MGIVTSQNMTISMGFCSCQRASKKKQEYGDRIQRKALIDVDEKTDEKMIFDASTEIISFQPDTKRIRTIDKLDSAQSTERLGVIEDISDDVDLENLILSNYATPNSDNESSSSENTKKEILKIKTEEIMNKQRTTSNVLRQSSEKAWNDIQIDDLSNEMKEELKNLSKQNSNVELNQLTQQIVNSDDDVPESNLFRDQSEQKWNNPLIDKQKDEMTKQLIHLAKLHKERSNPKQNGQYLTSPTSPL